MRASYLHRFLTVLVAAALLAACTHSQAVQQPNRPAERLWLVASSAALLNDLAPAQAVQTVPPTPGTTAVGSWRNPPVRWISIERGLVAREWVSAPRAARFYALLAIGMNDALLVANAAREQGLDVSDDAVVAAVAEQVMSYSHPVLSDLIRQHAADARWVGVWDGQATPAGVEAGQRIGQLVAQSVIDWARNDGAESFNEFIDPAPVPGVWRRTPPRLWSALDPGWGTVKPLAIPSAASMAAAKPPAWESAEFEADRGAFASAQRSLGDRERALAKKWAAGMGSMTPAGVWTEIAGNLIERDRLDIHQSAAIYATLAVAMHDAFIAAWYSKYLYMVERPITWMREADPNWASYIETPPFPSYPSGHATVSAAASEILAAYFPYDAALLRVWAKDASHSRIVGGIHWPLDGRAGLEEGERIAAWIVARASAAEHTATAARP